MLTPLQNFFHYSRGERRGTVLLFAVILLLLSWYLIRDLVYSHEVIPADEELFNAKLAELESQVNDQIIVDTSSLFNFDPNLIGIDEWMQLGFTEKQALSIEKYKSAGAVFKIKTDLKKLFMVDDAKYSLLEPYIDLPDFISSESKESTVAKKKLYAIKFIESDKPVYNGFENLKDVHYKKINEKYTYYILSFDDSMTAVNHAKEKALVGFEIVSIFSTFGYYPINQNSNELSQSKLEMVELNSADTTLLKSLKGIGSGFAKRIIKYRDQLGGFVAIDQLMEVYGLSQETYNLNLKRMEVDPNLIKKLNINELSVSELKVHPYIDWNVANSIVQIRNNYGKFAGIEDIKKSVLVDEVLFDKLKPYLSTE